MSRSITRVTKEGRINYLIRNRKKQSFQILFFATWDETCQKLMKEVEAWSAKEGDDDLQTVTSWDLPHAFMAFKITKVPCLVTSKNGKIIKQDYLPKLYDHFLG
tara:strand:- start:428 stop:739 length:312 start_codon:yes stop_codon:yes gene_type:complete